MATKSKPVSASRPAPARLIFSAKDVAHARLMVRASYDAARSTDENEKLWQYVDALSAAAANNPTVRATIRNRARYEIANNSYASGIIETLTNDTIGPEVRLQVVGEDKDSEQVEADFMAWAAAVRLWEKVRIMRRAKAGDGEAFALLITNKEVDHEVKLDVRPIECDMVESYYTTREDEIDGIRFDAIGNPIAYRVLKYHPGDHRGFSGMAGEWQKRKFVLHYFRTSRAGQVRGVSEILPALTLFGQLRKYTTAVIEAATRAAEISGVMQTDLLPDGMAAELADPVTIMEIERNAIMSLPEGWKLAQLKAEQPATTYEMFKSEVINEMARCLNMPYNVAAGNSSKYNYASGRLDHQTYDRSIDVERSDLQAMVLDRIWEAWLEEYATRKGWAADKKAAYDCAWYFASRGHVDPAKEATADDIRFRNRSLTYSRYYAKQGMDWRREGRQFIREQIEMEIEWNKARSKAGLPHAPFPSITPAAAQPAEPEEPEPPAGGKDEPGKPEGEGE